MSVDCSRAKQEALNLVERFGISEPPVNPVEIARNLGVGVHFVTFPGKFSKISGFYDAEDDSIVVNEKEFPLRQTFTIAHELGHYLLHREWAQGEDYKILMRDDTEPNDSHEIEANEFAGNLLVPRSILDNYKDLSKSDLSKLFAVSVPTISIRLNREYGI